MTSFAMAGNTEENKGVMKLKDGRSKLETIRARSESYGRNWCDENATHLGLAFRQWHNGDEIALSVRCYDRCSNKMTSVTMTELLDALVIDPDTGRPVRLKTTPSGQCSINENIYISALIYHLIQACWMLEQRHDHIM